MTTIADNRKSTYLLMALIACTVAGSFASGQEQTEGPKPEFLMMQVLVLDPDGHPVENATVFPTCLRPWAEIQFLQWDELGIGPPPKLQTNAEGRVELPYPKHVMKDVQIEIIQIAVKHSDFVPFRESCSVTDNPTEVRLERGVRLAATCVDADTGEPIRQDLYGLLEGLDHLSDWNLSDNGALVSEVFPAQKTWLCLIRVAPGQPNLYSELMEIDPADRSRVLLRDVKLSRGTRVQGRLDDAIPRPIKNGIVSARVDLSFSGEAREGAGTIWTWFDQVPIAPDGTFVFESLPNGEILQLIPLCDNWVPAPPSEEQVLPFYPDEAERLSNSVSYPQLIRLEGPQVEPNLQMVPATSVKVTVVGPDDQPLPGVEVYSWPNQCWFGDFGPPFLGEVPSYSEIILRSRKTDASEPDLKSRFSATTDETGICVIHTLPPNESGGLIAYLDGYEMPLIDEERSVTVNLKPDVVTEVTIKLQRVGTDALQDETFQGDKDN